MRIHALIRLAVLLSVAGPGPAAFAASIEDFQQAFAKATAASKQAAAMKTQWTTTVSELNASQKAADAGRYNEAVELARKAEALANASIAQAKEQASAWTDAVIR